jgi:hypothetical protein
MSALKVNVTLNDIQRRMADFAPYRKPELFNVFLLKGYRAYTLNSVPAANESELLRAKLCLGTLITLYDDFADRPSQANPRLLEKLYQLNFRDYSANSFNSINLINSASGFQEPVLEFARSLFIQIDEALKPLPNYKNLIEILNFDLAQFYSANRYSSLLTAYPHLNNYLEKRLYSHHNMGMAMATMMDLMAVENINFSELGQMREVFLLGQRLGRIFNVLATHDREFVDADITGELSHVSNELHLQQEKRRLRHEISVLQRKIMGFETQIESFSVPAYLRGLTKVQALHEKMEGVI